MTANYDSLHDLFSTDEINAFNAAPLKGRKRHPTWYPICFSEPRPAEIVTNKAVALIDRQQEGRAWLHNLKPRLIDIADYEEAASALAELRAYGALLEAGFSVKPIPTSSIPTADFEADAGDGPIVVEVFAKHQDEQQQQLIEDVAAGKTPPGVERSHTQRGNRRMEITTMELHPAGIPDPNKPHDCVQANLISRVCAAKKDETQFPADKPSLLWIDFMTFGQWPEVLSLEQAAPLISGHQGLTSGALWYAFYGWLHAPIFEEDAVLCDRIVPMGHDGRFRLKGKSKSKLAGVILSMHAETTLFENPWTDLSLPDRARRYCERLPWFNIACSVADWKTGDAFCKVELGRRQVEAMAQWREVLRNA